MSGAVVGNVFNNIGTNDNLNNLSVLEDLLLGIHKDYSECDFAEMAERTANEIAEAQERAMGDGKSATDLARERQERIESLQPNNLYNAMLETVNIGD